MNIKIDRSVLFLIIGVLGGIISLLGLVQPFSQFFYITGSALLLLTALYFRLHYFIALEIILIAGHGTVLLGIGPILQFALPGLLCLQLLIFYYLSEQLTALFILGIIGIAILSIGFSYTNQWVFFLGSTCIMIYAYFSRQVHSAALLWAVLNAFFALFALINIIRYYV